MAKRDPNPNPVRKRTSSAPETFTDAFLRKLTVPKGKTSNGKERKDIVIFEPRSGLGVRKTDMGAVSFLIQLRLPDGRRWRETLRPQWPHLSLADARRALQVRTGDIARPLMLLGFCSGRRRRSLDPARRQRAGSRPQDHEISPHSGGLRCATPS